MKKIYLTLAVVFLAGHLMAQKSTIHSNSTVKNSDAVSTTAVSNRGLSDLPGFPVYHNTGNKEIDDVNYGVAKGNWIKENEDIYNLYNFHGSLKTSVVLTGFPKYVITGDSEADYSNYKTQRANWLKENETLYVEYLQSIR